MGNPAKFDRCVRKVRRKSKGRVNAYAVCTAAGTRNPKAPSGGFTGASNAPAAFIKWAHQTYDWDAQELHEQGRTRKMSPSGGDWYEAFKWRYGRYPINNLEEHIGQFLVPHWKGIALSSTGAEYARMLKEENPSTKFGGDIHTQLVNAATTYDRKQAGKRGYNIYALGLYMNRIQEVEADIAAGTPVRKAITVAFTGRLQDAMLKAVGEAKGTDAEARGDGHWAYTPGSQRNPKDAADMSAPEINKALDKLDAKLSDLNRRMIDAGWGDKRPSDFPAGHPLTEEYNRLHALRSPLGIERDLRYGPGAPSRLPKGRGFGPRKWGRNPMQSDSSGNKYFKNRAAALSYATKLKRKGIIARAEHYGMGGDREWVVWVGGPMVSPGHHEAIAAMAPSAQWWKDHPEEEEALRRSGGGRFRSNPDSSAADMYSSFHGSPSEEVVEFREDEHYHGNLAGLGVLVELKLVTTTGYDVTLTFSDPEALIAANPGVWDRIKSIGSRSTVYPMPSHVEKMTKVGSVKGHEIFKTVHGDFRVPSLERESSFDSLGDAKKFVGAWKGNPGGRHYPDELRIMGSIREGEMILQSKKAGSGRKMSPAELGAVQRAVDNSKAKLAQLQAENDARYGTQNPGPFQSASRLMGKTGKYLDDQLGRVLNPWEGGQYIPEMYRDEYMEIGEVFTSPVYGRAQIRTRQETGESGKPKYIYTFIPVTKRERTRRGKKPYFPKHSNPGNPSQDPTLLCSNESGTQLYLQGGDQSVDLSTIHMADTPVKDSMVLGEAYFISYFTAKDFDNHAPTIYEHDLAEESDPPKPKYRKDEIHTAANRPGMGQGLGCYPMVRYDHLNKKLYLDGGEYKIDKPIMGTSPGIEN